MPIWLHILLSLATAPRVPGAEEGVCEGLEGVCGRGSLEGEGGKLRFQSAICVAARVNAARRAQVAMTVISILWS